MVKGSMTIKEVKEAKVELELKVLELVKDYEKNTGVYIRYFYVDRKKVKKGTIGELINITADMGLDLMF